MPRILSGLGERGREAYLTDRLSSLLGPLHSVAFPPEPVMDLLHGACQGGRGQPPPPPLPPPPPPAAPTSPPTHPLLPLATTKPPTLCPHTAPFSPPLISSLLPPST